MPIRSVQLDSIIKTYTEQQHAMRKGRFSQNTKLGELYTDRVSISAKGLIKQNASSLLVYTKQEILTKASDG
jgi:hypothetical protein